MISSKTFTTLETMTNGLKEELVARLPPAGQEVIDFGAHGLNPGDDYPDFVVPLARDVAAGNGGVRRGGLQRRMLLWSALHLSKIQAGNADYERVGQPSVTLDDIRRFRQLDCKAPDHPESTESRSHQDPHAVPGPGPACGSSRSRPPG